MKRKFKAPSPAMIVALIALFISLGGTSYAAINRLPPNSVGTAQLKPNAVTAMKIAAGAVTSAKINPAATLKSEAWHEVGTAGQPLFQHSCNNSNPTIQTVAYYKDRVGVVHLKGRYDSCTSAGAVAFQLPAGYRPEALQQYPLASAGPGTVVAIQGTTGSPIDGGVECGGSTCFLSGITFRAGS
jgi:hypothetical protein